MQFKSKKLNILTKEDAIELINMQESQHFDFKSIRSNGETIQKMAVAFNNADGGEYIIGIEDAESEYKDLSRWVGKESLEDFNTIIDSLSQISGLDYDWAYLTYDGQIRNYILYVKINLTKNFCKTSKNKVFYRNGAASKEVTDINEVRSLRFAKGCDSYESILIKDCKPEYLDSSQHLTKYIKSLKLTNKENLAFLEGENLINEEWVPNVACTLLFTDNPCVFIPQAAVRVALYHTSEEDEDREVRQFIERFEGPLFQLVDEIYNFIENNLNKLSVFTMKGLITPKYPKAAIWEILVNAVMHRDYSINDHVQIKIFNNRIEFLSPGKLPSHIRLNNILDKRFSRNPILARLLSSGENKIALEFGEGLNAANDEMRRFGLKPAVFEQVDETFKVTLLHGSYEKIDKIIINILEKFDCFTNRQLREITGLNQQQISAEIQSYKSNLNISYNSNDKKWSYTSKSIL